MSKVLVVDDSTFMRNVLIDILKEIDPDCETDEAGNGKEALEKCESGDYDLMLLDIIMAETGGIEVLQKVGKKVKTIVVSAVGQTSMIKEATDAGAVDYIVKPFDNEAIKTTLSKFLK